MKQADRISRCALLSESARKAFNLADYRLRHHARYTGWSDDKRLSYCLEAAFAAAVQKERPGASSCKSDSEVGMKQENGHV